MKKITWFIFILVLTFTAVAQKSNGSKRTYYTPEDSVWYMARTSNTIEAYANYLKICKEGTYFDLIPWDIRTTLRKDSVCRRAIYEISHNSLYISGEKIRDTCAEMPVYPGGEEAREKFLKEHLQYPADYAKISNRGVVLLTFVIAPDGGICNVSVIKGIGGGLDEEAVHVVRMMPRWNPGKQAGKGVYVSMHLKVTFS